MDLKEKMIKKQKELIEKYKISVSMLEKLNEDYERLIKKYQAYIEKLTGWKNG